MLFPKKVIIGHKVLGMIDDILNKLMSGNKGAIILMDENSQSYLSLINNIENYDFYIVPNGKDAITNLTNRYSVAIGLGGWKAVNSAKRISYEYRIPLVSIPTTISSEDLVNPKVTYKMNSDYKFLISNLPIAIIIDLDIICKNSNDEVLSGLGDVISKINAISDFKLYCSRCRQYYSEYAISLIKTSIQVVLKNLIEVCMRGERGLQTLIEALIGCGFAMGISGSRYVCEGAEHLFLYALKNIEDSSNLNHGKICLIGAIIGQYLHGRNWFKIKKVLDQIRAFTKLEDFKLNKQSIVKALQLAPKLDNDSCTIFSKVKVNISNIIEILNECEIVD